MFVGRNTSIQKFINNVKFVKVINREVVYLRNILN
jgi:hypothetical protein